MDVAAEFFATMLDVYLLLGLLPENAADSDTADGRPATLAHASARLARMWCADADDLAPAELAGLAHRALDMQVARVRLAMEKVLAGRREPSRVIVSGSGEVLGRQVVASDPVLCRASIVSL